MNKKLQRFLDNVRGEILGRLPPDRPLDDEVAEIVKERVGKLRAVGSSGKVFPIPMKALADYAVRTGLGPIMGKVTDNRRRDVINHRDTIGRIIDEAEKEVSSRKLDPENFRSDDEGQAVAQR